jgi:hypothetical protein
VIGNKFKFAKHENKGKLVILVLSGDKPDLLHKTHFMDIIVKKCKEYLNISIGIMLFMTIDDDNLRSQEGE